MTKKIIKKVWKKKNMPNRSIYSRADTMLAKLRLTKMKKRFFSLKKWKIYFFFAFSSSMEIWSFTVFSSLVTTEICWMIFHTNVRDDDNCLTSGGRGKIIAIILCLRLFKQFSHKVIQNRTRASFFCLYWFCKENSSELRKITGQ